MPALLVIARVESKLSHHYSFHSMAIHATWVLLLVLVLTIGSLVISILVGIRKESSKTFSFSFLLGKKGISENRETGSYGRRSYKILYYLPLFVSECKRTFVTDARRTSI